LANPVRQRVQQVLIVQFGHLKCLSSFKQSELN